MTAIPRPDVRALPPAWAGLVLGSAVVSAVAITLGGPLIGLLLILGLLAVVGVIAAPGVVLAAYLLIPFYKAVLNEYSPVDLTVLLALANAVQVVPLVLGSRRRSFSRVGLALWLGLGLLMLAGVLYAPDQSLALGKTITYWMLVILALVPAAMRVGAESRYLNQFLAAFFAMGALVVVLGTTQLSATDRLAVLGMNTIQMSRAALLVPILGVAFILPQGRAMVSVLTYVLIPAALVVAVASGSRGPLLMLVVLGVLGAIRYVAAYRARAWRLVGGVIGLVLLSLVALLVAAPDLPASAVGRFASLVQFLEGSGGAAVPGGETSAAARVSFAGFAVEMFADHPLVGAGTASFQVLYQAAMGPTAATYPHNALLQVGAEHGLLGLVLFAGLIAVAFTRRVPRRFPVVALQALALFFVLNSMVSGDIFTDRETLGLLLLILALDVPAAVLSRGEARPSPSRELHPAPG